MSTRPVDHRLRMELLRLRGELQRADAATALGDVRTGSQGIRTLVAGAFRVGSASTSGAGWMAALVSAVRERPWLLGMVMSGLRTARRHPIVTVIAAAAAFAAVRVLRPAVPREPAGRPAGSVDLGPD